jgi:PAS domain S-box-containing protein
MANGEKGAEMAMGDAGALPIGDAQLGRLILDSAVDYAIVTLSAEGDVTSWNEGAERILGWTETEITGRSSKAFFTPEDNAQDRMRTEMRIAAETGRATDERYHVRRDGTRFYAQGLMMPLRAEDAERHESSPPAGFLKIFRDETQRHEAQLRFRELEESVATALRASGTIGLYRFDPVAGIVSADASCAEMFDLDPDVLREGVAADAFFARVHPDDVGRVADEQRRTAEDGGHLDVTYRVLHANGRVRWLNTLSDLGREGAGDGVAAGYGGPVAPGRRIRSGVTIDVTERRREERIRVAVLEVGDGLRELHDPNEMARLAAKVMGRTLDLSRAGVGELDPDGDTIDIRVDWTARGAASIVGVLRYTDFGSFNEPLQRGETVVIEDARGDPRVADPAPLESIHARSLVNVPLMENGRLKAVLFVNDDRPRDWTPSELGFVRGVFDRTYAAIERVRAVEERKLMNRELAHRMKNVLTIAQVVAAQSLRHATTLAEPRAEAEDRPVAVLRCILAESVRRQGDSRIDWTGLAPRLGGDGIKVHDLKGTAHPWQRRQGGRAVHHRFDKVRSDCDYHVRAAARTGQPIADNLIGAVGGQHLHERGDGVRAIIEHGRSFRGRGKPSGHEGSPDGARRTGGGTAAAGPGFRGAA